MMPMLVALVAAVGTALLVDGTTAPTGHRAASLAVPLRSMSASPVVRSRGVVAVSALIAAVVALLAHAVFGAVLVPVVLAGFTATFPTVAHRNRVQRRRDEANAAWPRVIEGIRVHTSALGRSVPQALFDAGEGAPEALRQGFDAAAREWQLTTDFERALTVLRGLLQDPTADMACETLLVAHEVGGTDLDRRLELLAADRFDDVQHRKDATARLASARFARAFVLVVPAGMAVAGMSVGNGGAAYRSPAGQIVVLIAVALVVVCWWWSGRLLRIPEPQRVFTP